MRIDLETCCDPDLLAGEVRRLQAVIESGQPTLTDLQRAAIAYGVLLCDATAGMANDRDTIDGASRAADVLRGLLERKERENMTTPNDAAEPALASAGSQPVAIMSWEQADQIIQDQRAEIARLRVNLRLADAGFTFGPPTLTDEEKEAIALAKSRLGTSDGDWQADDVLAELLKRLG